MTDFNTQNSFKWLCVLCQSRNTSFATGFTSLATKSNNFFCLKFMPCSTLRFFLFQNSKPEGFPRIYSGQRLPE